MQVRTGKTSKHTHQTASSNSSRKEIQLQITARASLRSSDQIPRAESIDDQVDEAHIHISIYLEACPSDT